MDSSTYVDRLAAVAAELVVRVRDDDPQANARWLAATLPDPGDRERLLYVLAAAVPDDRPWLHLTAWTVTPRPARGPQPCGTPAAAKRHRERDEEPCEPCETAEREDWRLRKRDQRARHKTTP
ncbi:hypothetical protein [Salinispora arenicola]|uniref:hypothetical protein n=1 Tax=Salinispora arenicola TaxID=168697 RepID=UPI0004894FC8|nr:hypothetical protein [Salinispora arenicola]